MNLSPKFNLCKNSRLSYYILHPGGSMKFASVLLLIAFSFLSQANASMEGEWNGWAYWKYDGDGPKCTARMNFKESADKFAVLPGMIDCDIVYMEIPSKFFDKKENGELYSENQLVGKWTENTFEWSERYNERTVINVKIKTNGTSFDYKEQWIEDEKKLLYDVTGRLFKSR